MRVRPAAVAGMFYPADKAQLLQQLKHDLDLSAQPIPSLRAVILPHAGHIYCARIAAHALRHIRKEVSKILLVGPAHRTPFRGLALSSADFFTTPLGRIPLVKLRSDRSVSINDRAHAAEHCLEVICPYLQSHLDQFELLPVLVGQDGTAPLQELLSSVDKRFLVVISSDMSHFLNQQQAEQKDSQSIKQILALRSELSGDQACGYQGINACIDWAKPLQLTPELRAYDTSAKVNNDQSRVVGYSAFTFH